MRVKRDAVAGLICKIQVDILKNYDNCNVLIHVDAWSLVFLCLSRHLIYAGKKIVSKVTCMTVIRIFTFFNVHI